MNITIAGKERELKYTFNSFKYMKNFDVTDLDKVESKPFIMAEMLEILLMGAVNSNPRDVVSWVQVQDYLEEFIADGDMAEMFQSLVGMLQESNFFKSLRKSQTVIEETPTVE